MPSDRRRLAMRLFAGIAAMSYGSRTGAAEVSSGKSRVVYHLSDYARVHFVLGNMKNHFDGMGGPDNVTLALIVHGPALDYFTRKQADANIVSRSHDLQASGAEFIACGNTLRADNLKVEDLIPGFSVANEGGVVRLAKLQAEGYAYLRP